MEQRGVHLHTASCCQGSLPTPRLALPCLAFSLALSKNREVCKTGRYLSLFLLSLTLLCFSPAPPLGIPLFLLLSLFMCLPPACILYLSHSLCLCLSVSPFPFLTFALSLYLSISFTCPFVSLFTVMQVLSLFLSLTLFRECLMWVS